MELLPFGSKLFKYIMNKKGTIFQPRELQLNLDTLIASRTANTPTEKKIGEFSGAGMEPTTFCLLGRRPNH